MKEGETMNNIPTREDILSIRGSVPVEVAAKYLGVSKSFLYGALQKGVVPIGTAYLADKEWSYDIRPLALVEYNEHGGYHQFQEFRKYLIDTIQAAIMDS